MALVVVVGASAIVNDAQFVRFVVDWYRMTATMTTFRDTNDDSSNDQWRSVRPGSEQ